MLAALRQRLTLGTSDARSIVERTFRDHPDHRFAVRLWTGEEVAWGQRADFTLTFGDADTFRRCFLSADPAEFAEAYVAGRLLIQGDLWAAAGLSWYLRKVRIGCAHAFEDGVISVHQVLVAKPDERGRTLAPLTRESSSSGYLECPTQ